MLRRASLPAPLLCFTKPSSSNIVYFSSGRAARPPAGRRPSWSRRIERAVTTSIVLKSRLSRQTFTSTMPRSSSSMRRLSSKADPAAPLQALGDAVVVMRIAQEDRRHLVHSGRAAPGQSSVVNAAASAWRTRSARVPPPRQSSSIWRRAQALIVHVNTQVVKPPGAAARGPMPHRRVAARLAARVARQRVGGLEPRQLFVDMDVIGRHGGKRIIERADIEVDLGVAAGRVGQRRTAAPAMGGRDAGRGR